jgi:hypothetical protein
MALKDPYVDASRRSKELGDGNLQFRRGESRSVVRLGDRRCGSTAILTAGRKPHSLTGSEIRQVNL